MCGISGFYNGNSRFSYINNSEYFRNILMEMNDSLYHRGPDEQDIYIGKHVGLSHTRLSIIDLENGGQPMMKKVYGYTYGIVYNGEIYNTDELKEDLISHGWTFDTTCDTKFILLGFLQYGINIVDMLNGIFAFAIISEREDAVYLCRDRAGVKPLYYTVNNENLIFASEMKALFKFPGVEPVLDNDGLNQILSIGPAKSYGKGVFKDIKEVLPGSYIRVDSKGLRSTTYWKLISKKHSDSYEETLEKIRFLVEDSIKRQMISDVPICTFLSGGVDSSIVTAVCGAELKKRGEKLNTFSFDFKKNDKYFVANSFQPSRDRPYVDIMVNAVGSNHIYLECDSETQADTFPWTVNLEPRKMLLKKDFIDQLNIDEYVKNTYESSLAETPRLHGDSDEEARRREISYLNEKWFMQTLLDRMDRTSMYSGLEARVPFEDHRILEYMWNVPWEMKTKDGEVKHIFMEVKLLSSFEEICKLNYERIYKYVYVILRDEDRSKAVCQDVFMLAYEKGNKFLKHQNKEAFLYRTAKLKCYENMRRYNRDRGVPIEENENLIYDDTDLLDSINTQKDKKIDKYDYVSVVLNKLDKDKKRLYDLYYVQHKSMKEIAKITGTNETSLRMRYVRLRKEIKQDIRDLSLCVEE